METILRAESDVELIGPWGLGEEVCARITETSPSVIVIVDNDTRMEETTSLVSAIMDTHPELPIIRVGLNENTFRVVSTHMLPARSTDLLETIRNLPEAGSLSNTI